MKRIGKLVLVTSLLVIMSTFLCAQNPYVANDPYAEFSIKHNPNGVWSYGWSETVGSPFILFPESATNGWFPRDDGWGQPPDGPGLERSVGDPWTTIGGCAFFAPDTISMTPSEQGQYSIVRWTAPLTGAYQIRGYFVATQAALQGCATDTDDDVHVLWNTSQHLFDSTVIGFGHVAFFNLTQPFNARDTVDFVVGLDGRQGDVGKSAGLGLTIDYVPTVQIQPRHGNRIPVAILSDEHFNAPARVDPTTLTFGRIGNEPSLMHQFFFIPDCRVVDVNHDGKADLLCDFDANIASFVSNDTEAVLQGKTRTGIAIRATIPYQP